jgi:18S rRNA (adenine1779-N6/adenine1780-N6)-dimethyltransferase
MVADVKLLMDVSKRDFVPMPRVDSSLVEIRPRAVLPDVDLPEWLAFTRECFGQKNKTIGAIFKQKRKILDLFKRSQRTERCTGDAGGSGIILGVLDDSNDEACSGDNESSDRVAGFSEEDVGAFKERIASALESTELAGKRPTKMSNDELLSLLTVFNERGIWFQ